MRSASARTALALALALASGAACALGLGQIEVKSRAGQPLLAQIPVISSGPEELAQLRAGLADGTIDAIASDHQPRDADDKRLPFAQATVAGGFMFVCCVGTDKDGKLSAAEREGPAPSSGEDVTARVQRLWNDVQRVVAPPPSPPAR
mgnify:CR=1 FL=1